MIRRNFAATSLTLVCLLSGCSFLFHHEDSEPASTAGGAAASAREPDLRKQIADLQRIQKEQASEIADLRAKLSGPPQAAPISAKNRSEALEEKTSPAPIEKPTAVTTKVNPLMAQPAPINLPVPQKVAKSSDAQSLYNQFLINVKRPGLGEAEKDLEALLKNYRTSPLTSNAMYIHGDVLYDRAKYNDAATEFERLYKMFPDGNKAVAALFKLALCYQKMGHPQEAQEAFQNVVTVYPGSREALEAEKEIVGGGTP